MDVARLGSDKTVVYRNRGGVVTKIKEWSKKDTAETTDLAAAILEPHSNGVPMVIDIGGLGSGPFDNLRRMGFPVFGFDGSTKPVSDEIPRSDGRRRAQLLNIKWDRSATGRIFIEKKEEIKKRIGASPDDADTIMMSTVDTDEWELVAQDHAANVGRSKERPRSETSDLLRRSF
jgi:phage terminase large subunit